MALILLVEDEDLLRWAFTEQLKRAGHAVHGAENLAEAAGHLEKHQPDFMLLDLSLPDGHVLPRPPVLACRDGSGSRSVAFGQTTQVGGPSPRYLWHDSLVTAANKLVAAALKEEGNEL